MKRYACGHAPQVKEVTPFRVLPWYEERAVTFSRDTLPPAEEVIFPAWTAERQTPLSSVYVSTPQIVSDRGLAVAGHVNVRTVPMGHVLIGWAVDDQLEK